MKSLEPIERFLDGQTGVPLEAALEAAVTPEGRKLLDMQEMICDDRGGIHPPAESLAVWPAGTLPGVDDHVRSCRWCRLQILEARAEARMLIDRGQPLLAGAVSKARDFFGNRLVLVPAGAAACAAVAAVVWAVVGLGHGFDLPVAGPADLSGVKGASPLVERGMSFAGRNPDPALDPARIGYAAVWIRDACAAGMTIRDDSLKNLLGAMKNAPKGAAGRALKGKNPCGLFDEQRDSELCLAGALIASILDRGAEPTDAERGQIARAMSRHIGSFNPESRGVFSNPGELSAATLNRAVFGGLW